MSLLSNFKAPYDHTFIEFDYAQLEIRVLALASMDTNLINDINSGRDMHTFFASKIFSVPESAITKEQRKMAKGFSFQLQYGAGVKGIAAQWDVDYSLAKRFINEYYSRYRDVKIWQNNSVAYTARSIDYRGERDPTTKESVPTCFIPSIWKNKNTNEPVTYYKVTAVKPEWEEKFIPPVTKCKNYPIQGAASDIVMMMLHRLYKEDTQMTLLNTVHDSFLAIAPKEHLDSAIQEGKQILTSVPDVLRNSFMVESPVGFPVDYTYGDTLEKVKQKG